MIFDKEFLRKIKFQLIDDEKTIHKVIKCPHCNTNLEIYEVITSPARIPQGIEVPELNEIGYWIYKCKKCNKFLKIKVNNPDLLKYSYGYSEFYGFFIDDSYFEFKDGISLDSIVEVKEELVDNKIFKISDLQEYNFKEFSLYFCENCNEKLEGKIYDKLKDKKSIIYKEYYNYVNWSLAHSGPSPRYVIIKLNIKCNCGNKFHAFLYEKYKENVNINLEDSLLLVNVTNSLPLDKVIQGVFTKTEIMNWLYKLLIRWSFLFNKVYLVSPFVGHQFLKNDRVVATWTKIFKFLDPNKSTIIVRRNQLTNFKKSYNEINDIKYEDLEKFKIDSKFINTSKSKGNFHAKFFCGIKDGRCEVMSGSSNLVEGVSYEVINFNTFYNNDIFFDKYLKPLELDMSFNNEESGYSLLFEEDEEFKITPNSEIMNRECFKIIFGSDC